MYILLYHHTAGASLHSCEASIFVNKEKVKWGEDRALWYTFVDGQKVGGELHLPCKKSNRQQLSTGLMPIFLFKKVDDIENRSEVKEQDACLGV